MARPSRKGLTKEEIAALFEGDSDSDDDNVAELFSPEEIAEANQDPVVASGSGDEGDLDLPFELDDDEDNEVKES